MNSVAPVDPPSLPPSVNASNGVSCNQAVGEISDSEKKRLAHNERVKLWLRKRREDPAFRAAELAKTAAWAKRNPDKVQRIGRLHKQKKRVDPAFRAKEAEAMQRWRAKNKSKLAAYHKAKRATLSAADKQKINVRHKEWKIRSGYKEPSRSEYKAQYNKRWRAQNPHKRKQQCARHYARHKDKAYATSALRRAKLRGAAPADRVEETRRFIQKLRGLKSFVCYLCLKRFSRKHLNIDHIKSLASGGLHVPENLAAACERCNKSKNDRPVNAVAPQLILL